MLGDKIWLTAHPKMLNAVEVRALCRPVMVCYTKLGNPFLYGADVCAGRCHVETVKRQTNVQTRSPSSRGLFVPVLSEYFLEV